MELTAERPMQVLIIFYLSYEATVQSLKIFRKKKRKTILAHNTKGGKFLKNNNNISILHYQKSFDDHQGPRKVKSDTKFLAITFNQMRYAETDCTERIRVATSAR